MAFCVVKNLLPVGQKGDGDGVADADGDCVIKELLDTVADENAVRLREMVPLAEELAQRERAGDALLETVNVKDFVCRVNVALGEAVLPVDRVREPDEQAELLRDLVTLTDAEGHLETIGDTLKETDIVALHVTRVFVGWADAEFRRDSRGLAVTDPDRVTNQFEGDVLQLRLHVGRPDALLLYVFELHAEDVMPGLLLVTVSVIFADRLREYVGLGEDDGESEDLRLAVTDAVRVTNQLEGDVLQLRLGVGRPDALPLSVPVIRAVDVMPGFVLVTVAVFHADALREYVGLAVVDRESENLLLAVTDAELDEKKFVRDALKLRLGVAGPDALRDALKLKLRVARIDALTLSVRDAMAVEVDRAEELRE